jgi:hypothetical protein
MNYQFYIFFRRFIDSLIILLNFLIIKILEMFNNDDLIFINKILDKV